MACILGALMCKGNTRHSSNYGLMESLKCIYGKAKAKFYDEQKILLQKLVCTSVERGA